MCPTTGTETVGAGVNKKLMNHFQKTDMYIPPKSGGRSAPIESAERKNFLSALTIEGQASTLTGDNPALDGETRK